MLNLTKFLVPTILHTIIDQQINILNNNTYYNNFF